MSYKAKKSRKFSVNTLWRLLRIIRKVFAIYQKLINKIYENVFWFGYIFIGGEKDHGIGADLLAGFGPDTAKLLFAAGGGETGKSAFVAQTP